MSKKEHFVIVPIEIILKDDSELTHLFCQIYLKEISGVRYSFKDFCIDNDLDYNRTYRLKRLAKKTIDTAIANKNKKMQKDAKNDRYDPRKKGKDTSEKINEKQKVAKIKKQQCKTPQQTGVVGPLLETEIELITNYELLSDLELSKLTPSERMLYYAQHYDQFKKEGKI
jgi:hypothetical protein